MEKKNILISACLLGCRTRYDGACKAIDAIESLKERYNLIPVCPEQLGGLATPRDPAEIIGDGVCTKNGVDVTAQYRRGAEETLKLAKLFDCDTAILKERSPSCGYGRVYDGTFTGTLKEGSGVTSQLLEAAGIRIIGESRIAEELNI